ncbi:cyclase family protein [soil metagenome]
MFKIIDLTRTISTDMPGVALDVARTIEKDGWNATTLHIYSHAGTHVDAPKHFGVPGKTVDEIPLTDFIGPAWMVDLEGLQPRHLIELNDLGDLIETLQEGDSLVLKTGWSKYFYNKEYFRDQLPRIGEDLANWCVSRKIKMLGVEPPSVADVNNLEEVTRIHKILLSGGIRIVEGLTNLESIQNSKFLLMVMPLKISGGDGAPARAFAIEGEGISGFTFK